MGATETWCPASSRAPRGYESVIRALRLLRHGGAAAAVESLRLRLSSRLTAIGLERRLGEPIAPVRARTPLVLRPLRADDYERLFGWDVSQKEDEAAIRAFVRSLAESGVGQGYVAVDQLDRAGFVQFVYRHQDNDGIRRLFGPLMPQLAPGEALMEGAFTHPDARTKGLMPAAMAAMCAQLADEGLSRAIAFVPQDNSGALRSCRMAGFREYCVRTASWRLFRRSVRFDPRA